MMLTIINPDTVGVILADAEILDIIIALIIIYSILSPLLSGKKKKKSGKQSPTSSSDQRSETRTIETSKERTVSSSGDIFEEIGNILKEERGRFQTPDKYQDADQRGVGYEPEQRRDYRGYYEQSDYDKKVLEKQNEIMQKYDESIFTAKENVITVPDKVSEVRSAPPPIKKRFLSGLKDPETVREYIIANELLRKPKFPRRYP